MSGANVVPFAHCGICSLHGPHMWPDGRLACIWRRFTRAESLFFESFRNVVNFPPKFVETIVVGAGDRHSGSFADPLKNNIIEAAHAPVC